jgi:hypothetical protein
MYDSKHSTVMADSSQEEYAYHIKAAYEHLEDAKRYYQAYARDMKDFHRHLGEAHDYSKKINLKA